MSTKTVFLKEQYKGHPRGTQLFSVMEIRDSGYACMLCIVPDDVAKKRLKEAGVKTIPEFFNEFPSMFNQDAIERNFITIKPMREGVITATALFDKKQALQSELDELLSLEFDISNESSAD